MDPAAIDAELDRLEDGAEPAPVESRVREPVDPAAESEAVRAPGMDEPWCEVRLLGPTEVVRDGIRVEGLTPRPMEILAYLATHRDGVSKERLEDAVWSGRAAAPTSQRVTAALTKVRDALGDGPDGAPLVPRRTATQRIQVSDHVGTDIDRAPGHISLARDLVGDARLDELAQALDLVRGEPFEELSVSWASEITQRVLPSSRMRPSRSPAHVANGATSRARNMPRDRVSDSSIRQTLSTSNWQRSRSSVVTPRESACSGNSSANATRMMPMRPAASSHSLRQRSNWHFANCSWTPERVEWRPGPLQISVPAAATVHGGQQLP